ncbi:hypothetical protein [Winogradskyella flava]|uniref:Uncharacterized protein n=1 Tax=Winogradskyella flava TaxID=1884876 RepID=A0A842ITI0_9FLAO|nr:hypothetical protein [Winogradskyella flava]MBC2846085.1 hypothetical protein [Winogradskyella flava]
MKPKLPCLIAMLFACILVSCSPDDGDGIPNENAGEFIINGESYNLVSAIITDENTSTIDSSEISISLFNKTSAEITGNSDLSDISYVYFEIEDTTIQNTTYSQIEDYDVSINSTVIDSEFNHGTVLLSDDNPESDMYAQSASMTVTNFTQFNIAFTFTFTRNDGQVISGSYDGQYFMPSN